MQVISIISFYLFSYINRVYQTSRFGSAKSSFRYAGGRAALYGLIPGVLSASWQYKNCQNKKPCRLYEFFFSS